MRTLLRSIAIFCFSLSSSFLFSQYDSLLVGNSSGSDIFPGTANWFMQTNVPAFGPSASGIQDFDVNGDLIPELRFEMQVYGLDVDSMFIQVRTLNGSELRVISPSMYMDSLVPGQLLLASDNWISSQSLADSVVPAVDLFRGALPPIQDVETSERYMALRFPVQGVWQYAWIKYFAYGYSVHWGGLDIRDYAWKGTAPSVGVDPESEDFAGSIFPNPSSGDLNLQLPENAKGRFDLEIWNLQGQRVFVDQLASPFTQLDLGHLSQGIYLLQVRHRDGMWVEKWARE